MLHYLSHLPVAQRNLILTGDPACAFDPLVYELIFSRPRLVPPHVAAAFPHLLPPVALPVQVPGPAANPPPHQLPDPVQGARGRTPPPNRPKRGRFPVPQLQPRAPKVNRTLRFFPDAVKELFHQLTPPPATGTTPPGRARRTPTEPTEVLTPPRGPIFPVPFRLEESPTHPPTPPPQLRRSKRLQGKSPGQSSDLNK